MNFFSYQERIWKMHPDCDAGVVVVVKCPCWAAEGGNCKDSILPRPKIILQLVCKIDRHFPKKCHREGILMSREM